MDGSLLIQWGVENDEDLMIWMTDELPNWVGMGKSDVAGDMCDKRKTRPCDDENGRWLMGDDVWMKDGVQSWWWECMMNDEKENDDVMCDAQWEDEMMWRKWWQWKNADCAKTQWCAMRHDEEAGMVCEKMMMMKCVDGLCEMMSRNDEKWWGELAWKMMWKMMCVCDEKKWEVKGVWMKWRLEKWCAKNRCAKEMEHAEWEEKMNESVWCDVDGVQKDEKRSDDVECVKKKCERDVLCDDENEVVNLPPCWGGDVEAAVEWAAVRWPQLNMCWMMCDEMR